MQSFEQLSKLFSGKFKVRHFPEQPASLYDPNEYFLQLGGKRIRPVLCLMGNELFDDINPDTWYTAAAIELFHNFTLIHDDIMDKAPLRRGMETVHSKYGANTAILAGDVMLVKAYDYLNRIDTANIHNVLHLFNKTAMEVCEGQQMDMDFEQMDDVSMSEYFKMIELKTSVALAASLQVGAILGGAGQRNQDLIYEFGRKLGMAFQVQDDYLDAFGDPAKFGKQVGGDILANKKTFLLLYALDVASPGNKKTLQELMKVHDASKVQQVLSIYKTTGVDEWALQLQNKYLDEALTHLDDIAVLSKRKEPLMGLARFLMQREV